MNASTIQSSAPLLPPHISQQLRRFGPLIIIIAIHIALFYALRSGLVHQVAKALPREIFASFITEQPAPAPAPKPAEPKVVPVVNKQVARPTPRPVVTEAPSPHAITENVAPTPPSNEPPAPPAPAAPAAPSVSAQPKIITGIEFIEKPKPAMPPLSVRMGEEGVVHYKVTVNPQGKAEKVEITKSSGFPRLDEAAIAAVKRALFKPYMEDGKALTVSANGSINFTITR